MRNAPFGDKGRDAQVLQAALVAGTMVGTVGIQSVGLFLGSAGLAANGGQAIHQGHQLGDIVNIGPGEDQAQRDALAISEQVMLGA